MFHEVCKGNLRKRQGAKFLNTNGLGFNLTSPDDPTHVHALSPKQETSTCKKLGGGLKIPPGKRLQIVAVDSVSRQQVGAVKKSKNQPQITK